jgi:hypothetical protein
MIKFKWRIILVLCCATWFSCKHSSPVSICSPCSEIAEIAPFIEVRIVDKASGADLFLSPTSPYKFSDLTVTSSVNGTNVDVMVDSTQKNNRFIRILSAQSQTFTLKLASLPADEMNVVAARDSPKCCPLFRIKEITLNNAVACSPCTINQLITIKK